jgi:hypothetical protein
MDDLPEITLARQIARDAEKIFESALPSDGWNDVKIHQEKDFGLDYRIEAISNQYLRGYECYVQLKGFQKIEKKTSVPIGGIKTSTANYWKKKIIPILIVAVDCSSKELFYTWFDKNIEINNDNASLTITVLKQDIFQSYKIALYLDQYYGAFRNSLLDIQVAAFYRRLLHDCTATYTSLQKMLLSLLYRPQLSNEEFAKYEKHQRGLFLNLFIKFMHDLNIYRIGIGSSLADQIIASHIDDLFKIKEDFYCEVSEIPGYGVGLYNEDKSIWAIPQISLSLSDMVYYLANALA